MSLNRFSKEEMDDILIKFDNYEIKFTNHLLGDEYFYFMDENGLVVYYDLINSQVIDKYRNEYTSFITEYESKLNKRIEEIVLKADKDCCDFH
ncbi:hypothetical protein NSS71_08290 [Niallia sp. FSL W8-0951]|uniref:hypothetical protein n=1 Tax=Niallia sp. FSL W8-0951 TaxID=2954639 RepID=UPI0030F9C17F